MRVLEVSQFISILKWKEKEIFQYFSIKEGRGDSGERERSYFERRGDAGVFLTVL